MKISKTKLAAASFGVALTSLYSAPELCAQVDIEFTPTTARYFTGFQSDPTSVIFGGLEIINDGNPVRFAFYNDFYGLFIDGGSSFQIITGSVFNGVGTACFLDFPNSSTGIRTIGFVDLGEVGYFRIDLGQPGDPVTFIDGQLDTDGDFMINIPPLPDDDDVVLGDVDGDDDVDFEDIPGFIGVVTTPGGFQAEADIDMDGDVDFEDIPLFIELLTGGSVTTQAGLLGLAMGA